MDSTETKERLDKLSVEADDLADAVRTLTRTAEQITKRTRRSETVIACLVVSFILDVTLTVLVLIGLNSVSDAQKQVEQTQANGLIIRQQVLCPLYQLFLQSYSIQARNNNPRGPEWYDHAFATLRAGNQALKCAP